MSGTASSEVVMTWSTYDKPEKIDDRWAIIKSSKSSTIHHENRSIHGAPKTRDWYNLIDTTTGFIVNVVRKPDIKAFLKMFKNMGYTPQVVTDKYTNRLYNVKAREVVPITVCEYTSSCGKFKIRSWVQYTGDTSES